MPSNAQPGGRHYDLWLECLIEAVRTHDTEFSGEVEAAWRETLAVGVDYMRARY